MTARPWFWLLAIVLPLALLVGLHLLNDTEMDALRLAIVLACAGGAVSAARLAIAHRGGGAALAAAVSAAAAWLAGSGATLAAWVLLTAFFALLLWLSAVLTAGSGRLRAIALSCALAALAGGAPAAAGQIEAHFADEEFFVALQASALGAFWLALLPAWGLALSLPRAAAHRPTSRLQRTLLVSCAVAVLAGLVITGRAYQRSFFPPRAPSFAGISREAPFVCATLPRGEPAYSGVEVFERLIANIAANPHKGTPEYGMLALATGDDAWARAFRDTMLAEAAIERYAGPANSIKAGQYQAALRAYYYPRVREQFPGLFSPDDQRAIERWFHAINRRALTVEWVDWLYAFAFSKRPEGPYENQETGAGLLALLEHGELADPALTAANRDYLQRNQRGWRQRFRNNDDTMLYQPEWITNAYFQSLYRAEPPGQHTRLSFEWLLLQALPDGTTLRYNHPGMRAGTLAGVAYLGARLLDDPRYIWLAGRALDYLERSGAYAFAQPGVEAPLSMRGAVPAQGSCLLYGDTGLPNQTGPLAPDKIVLRDGWSADSTYVLLNLRFSGWHRYKATNAIMQIFQAGPLVAEELGGQRFTWLPEGRSLFRDKRIPREHLNSLLIERSGLGAVLHTLTAIGSPWAQDPPYLARVERFTTSDSFDTSTTVIDNWHGWRHQRTIWLYHQQGPLVVFDAATGPAGARAALTWQLTGATGSDQRIGIRSGQNPAELVIVPIEADQLELERLDAQRRDTQARAQVTSHTGTLRVAAAFLFGAWVGAEVSVTADQQLRIAQPGGTPILIELEEQ